MARASDQSRAGRRDRANDPADEPVDLIDEAGADLEGEDALAAEAEREAAARAERRRARGASGRSGNPATRAAQDRGEAAPARRPAKAASSPAKAFQRSGNPARRGRPGEAPLRPASNADWIAAARPRTLSMAIVPVMLGTAAAFSAEGYHLGQALACLFVAVLLQIGVNFANDYSDGVRGTDRHRVGPSRLTGSGRVEPRLVRDTAFLCFALAAVAGLILTVMTGIWWLPLVGAACILLAWFYTGGKRPYGYIGLGEIAAFIVFGLVATLGTQFVQIQRFTEDGLIVAVAAGCFAAALMLVNNLRDRESDRAAGKRTLATLLGGVGGKVLYVLLMLVPYAILTIYALGLAYGPWVFFTLLAAGPALIVTIMARDERDWAVSLGLTSLTALGYGIGLSVALWGGVIGFR